MTSSKKRVSEMNPDEYLAHQGHLEAARVARVERKARISREKGAALWEHFRRRGLSRYDVLCAVHRPKKAATLCGVER